MKIVRTIPRMISHKLLIILRVYANGELPISQLPHGEM